MDLTIHNTPPEVLKDLQQQAAMEHKSVEEEALALLIKALGLSKRKQAAASLKAMRERLFAKYGQFSDSAEIIRESREKDW